MIVTYANKRIRLICTDEKACRRFRSDIVDKVKLRHNALESAESMPDLMQSDPMGRWHPLNGDLDGLWSGRLSKNYRMLVKPYDGGVEVIVTGENAVEVVDIRDYH